MHLESFQLLSIMEVHSSLRMMRKRVLIGGPLLPIVEDTHLKDFLKVASTTTKLVHIYVVEITRAQAILKKMKEEAQELLSFKASKPPGVIIEEIEEATPNVPRQKPRPKRKQRSQFEGQRQEPLLIGWYDRDVEFEEYLTKSLEDDRAKRKRAEEVARQNLAKAFEAVSHEAPVSDFVAEKICVVDYVGQAEAGDGDSHAHVQEDVATASSVDHSNPIVDSHVQVAEDVATASSVDHSNPIVDVAEQATESESVVHQPSSVGPGAFVQEDVYRPVLDDGSQPIIEDITHELFMHEAHTQVQEPAPAEAACAEPVPVVGDVPQQADESVFCPSADYVPDGCHLHNEGSTDKDDDNDVGHFISLANMCRDEQMFIRQCSKNHILESDFASGTSNSYFQNSSSSLEKKVVPLN
ncbi:uncharacterized protein LOC121740965 isoform X2 [Salvia splendens]|uniref:uncharacterized protein LOC121740965 isoform X2 n=1 Tax=Salvia splendens TaxID=180675 RepID=UPI001C276B5E|nr:uncharacterized protein LOC121740965 isoform X2 [Salvia splendens]